MVGLLLLLTPAVALSGPPLGGRAQQEEEESAHSAEQVTAPRPGQFQPLRPPRRTPLRSGKQVARYRAAAVRAMTVGAPVQSRLRVWRPSPLLADPDPDPRLR